jgi:glycogen debranching enzyme
MELDYANTLIQLTPRTSTRYVSRDRTVLAIDANGFISGTGDQGLWCFETRMLSVYRWFVNGKQPLATCNSAVEQHRWVGYYIAAPANCKDTETHDCDPAQQTIELQLTRIVGHGFCEKIELTNHTQISTAVALDLEVDADFADPAETQGGWKQRGRVKRDWYKSEDTAWILDLDYQLEHKFDHQGDKGVANMHRGIRLRVESGTCRPRKIGRKIKFTVRLMPHETWRALADCSILIDGEWLPSPGAPPSQSDAVKRWDSERIQFLAEAACFSGSDTCTGLTQFVLKTLDRSKQDLIALRLFDLDPATKGWVVAGGVPSYVGFFGRDSIATAWEAMMLSGEPALGALMILSAHQASNTDDWRDEQPGRMIHEIHTNPLAVLNFTPHARYYGDITASIHFPVLVAALWHWTGNKDAVCPFIEPAMRALRWADENANVYGDGFYRYQTRSEQGEKNQGWKDSSDAIVDEHGRQVADPLGTCEMQGFVYASKLHFSELLWWLGETEAAKRLYSEAEELKKRFNDRFWMEQEQFFAMGIDSRGQLIRSVASDPGHCLVSGIVDQSLVRPMVARFLQGDLFSGWGIRSLSSNHPAFNPYAYHRGTVWPVENGVFVLAMARHGLHAEANQLSKALFEAASLFQYCRLPEVFAGHPRDENHPFPGMYPQANSPQAWSASAPFCALQALLGIYPYAPLKVLLLDPWLPEWLPSIRLKNLRVGEAIIDLHFHREEAGTTAYRIEQLRGDLHIIRQPSPWSLTASYGERVKDAITSLLPGH